MESELIVNQDRTIYHLGLAKGQLAKNVVVCGDPKRAELIAGYFDAHSVGHAVCNREFVSITGMFKGLPVTVIGTGIGPDNTEIVLVEAYTLNEFNLEQRCKEGDCEALNIIRVGTCGTPQADVEVGSLAISAFAIGLDSTGLFYDTPQRRIRETGLSIEKEVRRVIDRATPENRRFKGCIYPYVSEPSPEVAATLEKHARGERVVGITASASGFFAPQGRDIAGLALTVPGLQEHLSSLNVDGYRIVNIEMETALMFHLAGILGYRAGAVCAVIANRITGRFQRDYESIIRRAAVTALEALLDLNQAPASDAVSGPGPAN